jgi:hypothetical protein
MSPGATLLFPDHPYNVGARVLDERFLGSNQLIVIADAQAPDGIKRQAPLEAIAELTSCARSSGVESSRSDSAGWRVGSRGPRAM